MDLNVFWSPGSNANIADGFNVFYKEYDPLGLNNWILANPSLLPYTATSYTIAGLSENTVYRVMIVKSCLGVLDVVNESTVVASGCPIIATWQGPVVNGYPTLFYSVYYPDGDHMNNARLALYDTQINDTLPTSCPTPTDLVVGRTTYLTTNFCLDFTKLYCSEQQLDFLSPSNTSSAVSYFGRDTRNVFPGNSLLGTCDNGLPTVGGALAPLLLKYNNDYKFNVLPQIKYGSEFFYQDTTCFWYAVDVTPFSFVSDPTQTYPNLNLANVANISPAFCFNPLDVSVKITNNDGTGRTNISDYSFNYEVYDTSSVGPYPYLKDNGLPETSNKINFRVYGEMFFSAGFSNYITDSMDITIEFSTNVPSTLPVLSLTGENYSGYTLLQFLSDLSVKINTIGTYTSTVVPLGSGSYGLRVYHSDTTIQTLDYSITGLNNSISVVGTPILQNNFASTYSGILFPVVYNGFIYGARGQDTSQCNIQASEVGTGITSQYNHTIDFTVSRVEVVPTTPGTVYPIYNVEDGEDIAVINVAVNPLTDEYYLINNTTIYLYDSSNTLVSSETFATLTITGDIKYVCYDYDLNIVYLFDDTTTVHTVQYAMSAWNYLGSNSYGGYTETGGIVYNSTDTYVYMSIGDGEIAKINSISGLIATYQMLEPDASNASGAFHLTVYNGDGTIYATKRDITTGATKNIYSLDTSGVVGSIDGSLYWNNDVCGALSFNGSYLYFTSADYRFLYNFEISDPTTYLSETVPNIYNRLGSTPGAEKLMNAQYLIGNKFLMMSKVNNGAGEYDIVNLFIYDIVTQEVEVIAGAPDESYAAGPYAGWNVNSYGVAIGYKSGNIDNYSTNLNITVNPHNGFFYFKVNTTTNTRVYSSSPVVETGVAQLWGTLEVQNSPNLIRIWNILSDGSLVPSAKNIFQKGSSGFGAGPLHHKYDSYYDAVVTLGWQGDSLQMFRPKSFTSWAGTDSNPLTSTYSLGLGYTGNYGANDGLWWPGHFMTNDLGNIAVFAQHWPNPGGGCGLTLFTPTQINGQVNSTYPTTPNFCAYYAQAVYVPSANTYWRYGEDSGNKVIRVYNSTLTSFTTINLPPTIFSTWLLMTLDVANNKVWLYNPTLKLVYDATTLALLNSYSITSSGAIIPYSPTESYMDYLTGTPNEEAWGLLGYVPIDVITPTYQYLSVTVTDSALATATDNYDLYSNPSFYADTFGQWKEITGTTWATIPTTIATTLGTKLEFTSFILNKPLVAIRNITQSTTYAPSNTLNSINVYTITADSIDLFNGDLLEFEFTNPDDSSCPFINQSTITF